MATVGQIQWMFFWVMLAAHEKGFVLVWIFSLFLTCYKNKGKL